ncbi:adventurous gliding motility lipoprotein CglC [Cystobacter fuscus]|uniref:adventurous gliding motility lipoprotein CglC n=1 Tax=Cystobacter fuscus TaxID=43 RepID=UPI002B314011|nr:adventurous gliding motility lipoprotein CglD [Cystobacter fuscus]
MWIHHRRRLRRHILCATLVGHQPIKTVSPAHVRPLGILARSMSRASKRGRPRRARHGWQSGALCYAGSSRSPILVRYTSMSARLGLLLGAALLCGGCEVRSDTGKPCVLVKKDPNGTTGLEAIPVSPNDILFNQDFISFGAVGCENLVCVRTAGTELKTTGEGDAIQVLGYCSEPCTVGSATDCTVTDPQTAEDVKKTLECRPLLLDEVALATMKKNNPAMFEDYFGRTESPNFCASKSVGTTGS